MYIMKNFGSKLKIGYFVVVSSEIFVLQKDENKTNMGQSGRFFFFPGDVNQKLLNF